MVSISRGGKKRPEKIAETLVLGHDMAGSDNLDCADSFSLQGQDVFS